MGRRAAGGEPIDFVEGRLTVKRAGLWAIALGVVVSIGEEQGYAGERAEKCTLATLNGQHLFSESGTLLPPAFGVTEQSIANTPGFPIFTRHAPAPALPTLSLPRLTLLSPSPV